MTSRTPNTLAYQIECAIHNISHFQRSEGGTIAELDKLNESYMALVRDNFQTDKAVSAMLLFGTYRSFITAVTLLESLQLATCYPILRSILESSLYAFSIGLDDSRKTDWIRRDIDSIKTDKLRESMKIGKLKRLLGSIDHDLSIIYSELYDSTIKYGAHPNPQWIVPYIRTTPKSFTYEMDLFETNPVVLDQTIKLFIDVCGVSIRLFLHIWPISPE